MSEEIREFVAGEKITVTTTLGHEASGMDYTEGRSLLGNGYRLDLVGVPGVLGGRYLARCGDREPQGRL
jgi:hypothetical protein